MKVDRHVKAAGVVIAVLGAVWSAFAALHEPPLNELGANEYDVLIAQEVQAKQQRETRR